MNAAKFRSRVGNLMRILLFMLMSDLAISQNATTSPITVMETSINTERDTQTSGVRSQATTSPIPVMETSNNTEKRTQTATVASELALSTSPTFVTLIGPDMSTDANSTDVTDVQSSRRVSDPLEEVTEVTTFAPTSIQDNQQGDNSTTSFTGVESSSSLTDFKTATDGDSTEGPLVTESVGTGQITTSGQESTTLTIPNMGVTNSPSSAMSATSASSSSSLRNTNQETTAIIHQGGATMHFNSPRSVPEPPRVNTTVTVIMSLDGESCKDILQDKNDFLESFKNQLVQYLDYMGKEHVEMMDAKCGSVVVDMILLLPEPWRKDFHTDMETKFHFMYKGVMLKVDTVRIEEELPTVRTTPAVNNGETTSPNNNFQQTLIFIVIGSVGGAFLLLSCFLLCQYLTQKVIKASRKSYRPSDEPCIKLADFNMAHTYIPRPQSIYNATATTRSSFMPFESMDHGYSFPSAASPTPYVYADGDQIREHYQAVVEKDPVTPTSKTISDFGRSGIPNWDLPDLEGIVHEGANGATLRIDDRKQTTSSTFHAPPDDIPPPPTSSPPPPPPSVEYHPPGQRGAEGSSLKSDDGSSHTEQSSGDTRHLIRGQQHRSIGIDNPAADIDNVYF